MLLLLATLACFLSVPLAGGRLSRLALVPVHRLELLLAALALQVLILTVLAGGERAIHAPFHVLSYVLAVAFVWCNRRVPGVLIVGLGGLLNGAAIAANDGVMPATAGALKTAGLEPDPSRWTNSQLVEHADLWFLGDVFAIPASWPAANVFSVGDVLIVVGLLIALHRICASKLRLLGPRALGPLAGHRPFQRLWAAQGLSTLGDWIYTLAVIVLVTRRDDPAQSLALLLVLQMAPAVLVGVFGGALVDRLPRKRLMVAADVLRAAAVGSLLLAGEPSLAHLAVVAVGLGVFGARFTPSLQASLPGLVPAGELMRANAILFSTHNLAIMVGPMVGGFIAAQLGGDPAFALNAASFVVSAALVAVTRFPAHPPVAERARPLAEIAEGLRHVRGVPVVRALVVVGGLIMLGAALKAPLEPVFILQVLGERPETLGLAAAVWGLGMVAGSGLAPVLARRWPPALLLAAAVGVAGTAVVAASQAPAVIWVLGCWLVAGVGNGVGVVVFETTIQERTPDRVRGRVIATTEAVMDAGYLVGALSAGWLAASFGARIGLAASGLLFLAASVVALAVAARRRRPAPFTLRAFEAVAASPDSLLVRVRADGPGTALALLVDDGRTVHRVAPLPGSSALVAAVDGEQGAACGFGLPADLVRRSRPAFALELSSGEVLDLPAPAPRAAVPVAA